VSESTAGSAGAKPVTVIVADDHPAMVEAICDTLAEEGLEIVGRAVDGEEALARVHERGLSPAAVLVRRSTLEDVFLRLTGRTLVD